MLKPIDEAPTNKRLLLYWETLNHFEDGIIYRNENVLSTINNVLFDGNSLDIQPTHWMELPCKKIDYSTAKTN